jgi:hypothetical protein
VVALDKNERSRRTPQQRIGLVHARGRHATLHDACAYVQPQIVIARHQNASLWSV